MPTRLLLDPLLAAQSEFLGSLWIFVGKYNFSKFGQNNLSWINLENDLTTLASLFLPEGLLDYFNLVKIDKGNEELNLYLEEKNVAPAGYENVKLESKGLMP